MDIQEVTLLNDDKLNALVTGIVPGQVENILADMGISPAPKDGIVEMEKVGALDSITNMKVFDIPVGQAAVGGLTAMIISALADMAMKPVRQQLGTRMGDTALKAAAAYAVNRWGKDLLGKDATKAAVIILAWEAFESFVPEVTSFVHDKLPAPSGLTTPVYAQLPPAETFIPAAVMQMGNYPMITGRFG